MSQNETGSQPSLAGQTGQLLLRPTFDVVVRGYDRKQVAGYLLSVEAQLAVLTQQNAEATKRADELLTQMGRLEQQLLEQHRLIPADRPSYRHLGARVEQIFSLVEEESDEVKRLAEQEVAKRFQAAEKEEARLRSDAEEQIAGLRSEIDRLQTELDQLTQQQQHAQYEFERELDERRVAARQEVDRYASSLREEAERTMKALVDVARHDANTLVATAKRDADHLLAEARQAANRLIEQKRRLKGELHGLREVFQRLAGASDDLLHDDGIDELLLDRPDATAA